MLEKYSMFNMLNEFQKHRPLIHAYLKGESVEHYDDDGSALFGMSVGIFLLLLIVVVGIWIWALVTLIQNWAMLETWAKVLGVIGLFPAFTVGGPIMTLVVAHIGKISGPTAPVYAVGQPYYQTY